MNRFALALILAAAALAASAQTPSKPTTSKTPAAKSSSPAAPASATKPSATAPAPAPWIKLPPGVTPLPHQPVKIQFALRYEEIKVGTGPLAQPHKVYRVKYTGWLAADGRKFDSSDDHPAQPVYDSSLQQVMGADGKPKMEAAQPILFLQGRPGMIPGWDMGFDGMRVSGKRRLFIPYQLAYGEAGRPNSDPKNPGIPAKADLIFDIELVEMMELPAQPAPPTRPGMPPHPAPATPPPGASTQPNTAPAGSARSRAAGSARPGGHTRGAVFGNARGVASGGASNCAAPAPALEPFRHGYSHFGVPPVSRFLGPGMTARPVANPASDAASQTPSPADTRAQTPPSSRPDTSRLER
jgi:peptidylprolyl isomerase